jgi:serine/threonine protein kinase
MSLPGQTVGPYAIEAEIGQSRWGPVYRAVQQFVGRTVALKTVSPAMAEVPGQPEHFLEVMRATAQLSHANIATIYEAGRANGTHYCAMEFLDGPLLAEFLRREQTVDEQHLLQTVTGAARALNFLWQHKVPHRPPEARHILTSSTGLIKLINVLPLDSLPSSSPQEDILALGLILANLANEISPVSRPVGELVERMVGTGTREPFVSLSDLAAAAEDLEHELFPPPSPMRRSAKKSRPKLSLPLIVAVGLLAAALIIVGLMTRRLRHSSGPAAISPTEAPAAP